MFLDEGGDRTSLWPLMNIRCEYRGVYERERSSTEGCLLKGRLWFPVVCMQGSHIQLIITKGCLFMESGVRTTIPKSLTFCLNTFLISNMYYSLCSG